MKLREIYIICKQNIDKIEKIQSTTKRDSANNSIYSLTKMNELLESINNLSKIECLKNETNKCIQAIPVSFLENDSFDVSSNVYSIISTNLNVLKSKTKTIIDLYESMQIEEVNGTVINVKLPRYNDYDEFVKYNKDFQFVIQQSPFLNVEGTIFEFNNVDVGSTWLTFFIPSTIAINIVNKLLNNLVALIDKCIVVHSHYLYLQQQKELIRQDEKKKEKLNEIDAMLEELYKAQVKKEIEILSDKLEFKIKDGEEYSKAKKSLEILGDLIDKGLEIRSEISSSSEVQKLFKPLESKYLKFEEIKLITEKNDDNEKEV